MGYEFRMTVRRGGFCGLESEGEDLLLVEPFDFFVREAVELPIHDVQQELHRRLFALCDQAKPSRRMGIGSPRGSRHGINLKSV